MSRGQPLLHPHGFLYFCPLRGCPDMTFETTDAFRRHIEDEHPECLLGTAPGGYSSSVAVVGDRTCSECGDPFRPNWIGQQTCSQRCSATCRPTSQKPFP